MTPLEWTPDTVRAMVPSVRATPWGAMETAGDVLGGSFLFRYQDGNRTALLAVRPVDLAAGVRLDVVGLVSYGERLAVLPFQSAVDAIGRAFGARELAMCTRREHVARQAERAGWQRTGYVMTKELQP